MTAGIEWTVTETRLVIFARATDGLVTGVTTKATSGGASANLATSVVYRPFGPLATLTYGNGLALTRTYNNNYWLTRTEVKATGVTSLDLTFGRNANGQLTGYAGGLARKQALLKLEGVVNAGAKRWL